MSTRMSILRVKAGQVELINGQGQRTKTYYPKGDAVRADWYDQSNGKIQVVLESGETLVINSGCQIIQRIR